MRLIARFAQEKKEFFEVITVYDEDILKEQIDKKMPTLISIAKEYPAAIWFERKIRDDFGIKILDTVDERPLVKQEHFPANIFPMRKDFIAKSVTPNKKHSSKERSSLNMLIGPTHPYHLESSQFKLVQRDEKILDFEFKPFQKHRGIEKMLEGLSLEGAREIVERISASDSVAYQMAFLDIELQASKKTLPEVIKKRHVFLLELERIINHLTALAVICQEVHFDGGAEFLNRHMTLGRKAMKSLTASRFGFSSVRVDSDFSDREEVYEFLLCLEKELPNFEQWILKRKKTLKQTLGLGVVSREKVIEYGLVGLMARCVDVGLDRRHKNNFFLNHEYCINREEKGDTFSRFTIRISEIFTSLRMMRSLVENNILPFFLGTSIDGEYYSYVESSAGELMMYISLKDGLIERFFLRDPTFLNAQVLASCIKNSNVSDLSLMIKSIPLNISAIDL